jgi:putative ABC transport system permease protein
MCRLITIMGSSLRIAMLELLKAKLRTFLSLLGITIGIFCITGVLATVASLELNLQSEIRAFGANTIYVDKWQYSAGPDFPYWKYTKRPAPAYSEMTEIRVRTPTARHVAFKINVSGNVEGGSQVAGGIRLYGISEEFSSIQPFDVQYGRYLSENEFFRGASTVIAGYSLAEALFGNPKLALNKTILFRGQQARIVGILKKQGTQLISGWGFDQSVIMPYKFARTLMDERKADPLILVQGREGISSQALKDDLTGTMRTVRRLSPAEEVNFSLNDISDFSDVMNKAFTSINLGGWIIGTLAFIVGIFGVANIMFITVKERTPQIGLKKAIGAKGASIITEFLIESAFLCIVGGLIGLLLVFWLTRVATAALQFPIFLSRGTIGITLLICIAAGMLAGIIPALQAAKMNPVEAIRS